MGINILTNSVLAGANVQCSFLHTASLIVFYARLIKLDAY